MKGQRHKMDKNGIIKEILGNMFLTKGFTYRCEEKIWMFERKHLNKAGELINQQVYVQESNFEKSLYFRMQTNAYGQLMVDAQRMSQDITRLSYPFQNDQQFEKWIEYFAELMETKGFDVLQKISEPTVVERPTKEQHEYLFRNTRILAKKFMEDNHIVLECDENQLMSVVFETIKPLKNEKYQKIFSVLLELAAFYGEWLIKEKTGKWYYEVDLGARVEFLDMGGFPTDTAPLSRVFLCWERFKEIDENQYIKLQHNILL